MSWTGPAPDWRRAGSDVSWARLDLVLLYDGAAAHTFTIAYEAATGSAVSDLDLWDLYAATNAHPGIEGWAPNYQELGRTDLGPAALRRRLDEWMSLTRRHP